MRTMQKRRYTPEERLAIVKLYRKTRSRVAVADFVYKRKTTPKERRDLRSNIYWWEKHLEGTNDIEKITYSKRNLKGNKLTYTKNSWVGVAKKHKLVIKGHLYWKTRQPIESYAIKARKEIITMLAKANNKTIIEILNLFGLTKRQYYYKNKHIRKTYNETLANLVQKEYDLSHGNYGRHRLKAIIQKKYGLVLGDKLIYGYMKKLGIKSLVRNTKAAREAKKIHNSFPYLIHRDFRAHEPYWKWYMDASYIKTREKTFYFYAILDGFNNEILAWKLCKGVQTAESIEVLRKACKKKPANKEVILNTDHGTEYTAYAFVNACKELNVIQSMGTVDESLDNRPIEYFFSILKYEWLYRVNIIEMSFEEIHEEIKKFIYWYNNVRIQLCLKDKTPVEYKAT